MDEFYKTRYGENRPMTEKELEAFNKAIEKQKKEMAEFERKLSRQIKK